MTTESPMFEDLCRIGSSSSGGRKACRGNHGHETYTCSAALHSVPGCSRLRQVYEESKVIISDCRTYVTHSGLLRDSFRSEHGHEPKRMEPET